MLYDIGLILEGGGMRGVYTAGVLDFFHDKELHFKNIYGTSAGACNAVSYISGQRKRSFNINYKFCKDKRYVNIFGLLTRGSVFGMDFMFDDIPNKLLPFDYEAFKKSPMKLTAVTTDCHTGKARYFPVNDMKTDDIYVRASSSIPIFANIVCANEYELLDGGVADSIPIEYSIKSGNKFNIVVLTRHDGYVKKPSRTTNISKIYFHKFPSLVKSIANRHINYNNTLSIVKDQVIAGNAIVIQPSTPVNISRFENNQENLKNLYKQGYNDAKAKYEEIKTFLHTHADKK